MSIIRKLLGEDEPYSGVVYPAVIAKPVGDVIELSFPGRPATQILGISREAAAKLVVDLQAIAAGSSQPPASSASVAPAGTPPGPST